MSLFHSIWTVVMFIVFIGIVLWAYNGKRKQSFDEAANLPLEDDDDVSPQGSRQEEKSHV